MATTHTNPSHELKDFMQSATRQMQEEYIRIQKRVREDPGTAGDQAEENWATLLRGWLPHNLHIVTKGRIIGYNGEATPQLDVLILRPEYPPHLLDKKLYIAGGVLAAFECKTTLRKTHFPKIFSTCASVKDISHKNTGTLRDDLCSPILYGVLAHSSEWSLELPNIEIGQATLTEMPENEHQIYNYFQTNQDLSLSIFQWDKLYNTSPVNTIDLICIADLTNFSCSKLFNSDNYSGGNIYSIYTNNQYYNANNFPPNVVYNVSYPIGSMFTCLLKKLAWQIEGLRSIATYFGQTGLGGAGMGKIRMWPLKFLSDETLSKLSTHVIKDTNADWNKWNFKIDS